MEDKQLNYYTIFSNQFFQKIIDELEYHDIRIMGTEDYEEKYFEENFNTFKSLTLKDEKYLISILENENDDIKKFVIFRAKKAKVSHLPRFSVLYDVLIYIFIKYFQEKSLEVYIYKTDETILKFMSLKEVAEYYIHTYKKAIKNPRHEWRGIEDFS